MRQGQVELIRARFGEVLLAGDSASAIFYDRLFELAPETRALFANDLAQQGRLLIATLAKVVTGLSHQREVLPALRELAIRHVAYGARVEHYAIVGEALIWMVGRVSVPRFDPAIEMAWRAAYDLVAQTMIEAAYGPTAADRRSENYRSAA
jgi:hemoglobin-like flavoprotein